MTFDRHAEARRLFWELAIARKLRETALKERRFADANHYAKCLEAAELKAHRILAALGSETAMHWLQQKGQPREPGGYVPGTGFRDSEEAE